MNKDYRDKYTDLRHLEWSQIIDPLMVRQQKL